MFRPVRSPCLVSVGCVLAALIFAGCDRWPAKDTDERREANFQAAYNLAQQGLHEDAIKAYYRALEANPRNAIAHRELGQLYLERKQDYATAIYHFRRCQEIRATRKDKDANDYTIEQAIKQAQMQLAIECNEQIGRQQTHSQLDELKRRNAELEAIVARLSQPSGTGVQPVSAGVTNEPPTTGGESSAHKTAPEVRRVEVRHSETRSAETKPDPAVAKSVARPRTHIVKPGETPAAIARQHGLTTAQLMAVNKSVDARRLRPGQALNLPATAK